MPGNEIELKNKLMELVNTLATDEGVTSADLLSVLSGLSDNDPTNKNVLPQSSLADGDDEASMANAQSRADSAFAAIGKRAPSPFSGEKAIDYRKRVLSTLQPLAPECRRINVRAIADSATLAVVEDKIYGDSLKSYNTVIHSTKGYLHQTIRTDSAGRRIVEFHGDPNAWLSAFKIPPQLAGNFNTSGRRH